jgi:toxin ParE1/3/4
VTRKPVILLPLAERDIGEAMEHYRYEGGARLATRWARAVSDALRGAGRHPAAGSQRYADMLGIPGLRFWRVKSFPFLVFYVERASQVDIWRVLHGRRDIAEWLHDED